MKWEKKEIERFKKAYPETPTDDLLAQFPGRTLKSLEGLARRLRIKRIRPAPKSFSGQNSSFSNHVSLLDKNQSLGGVLEMMNLEKVSLDNLLEEVSKRGFISQKREVLMNRHYTFPKVKKPFKIGVVGDTHLGSEKQQITYLRETYRKFKELGITKVLHAGDMVEGNGRQFKGQLYEMFLHGADAMIKYVVEAYPNVPGITTYVIGGSHDFSYYKDSGMDVLGQVAERRKDIKYLGVSGAHINIGGLKIYLMHGESGNAYARSYRLQKIIEQLPADTKPHILLLGHYHTVCLLPQYRNVAGFQLPCFQAQTQYLKAKGLNPEIGYLVLEITPDSKGMSSFKPDFHFFPKALEGDY